jgi:hypothetical protein
LGRASWFKTLPAPTRIYAVSAQNLVFQPGVPIFVGATPASPYGVMALNRDFTTPHVHNFNFNIQRELGPYTMLQVGYAGSRGRNLALLLDINQPSWRASAGGALSDVGDD